MPSETACVCNLPAAPNFAEHLLEHTAAKEEFIIEQYTQVLEAAEDQYLRLGELLMETEKGSFEARALQGVLDHVRETMVRNEESLRMVRESLWKKFEEEGGEVYI